MYPSVFFPTTIMDGFLDDPDEMRKLGLSQTFTTSEDGRWPGKRSPMLHQISEPIFYGYMEKIFSLFYSDKKYFYSASACFQLVGKEFNSGWVHSDPDVITAILYLTPKEKSGTSLFTKKNYMYNLEEHTKFKTESYLSGTNDKENLNKNNNMFEESIKINGVYNRLVLFDSRLYHSAHTFFGNNNDDSRLTLVTFVGSFNSESGYPVTRCKRASIGHIL